MKLGTWNVRSFYRASSLKAAARELARYKLDVVGVQEVRWDKEGTVRAGDYNFFYGRPRLRWVDNIRMDFQEVGCGYVDWIGLAQDRDRWRTLVSTVMNLRVPSNAGNFLISCKPVSFSRRTLHRGVSKYSHI